MAEKSITRTGATERKRVTMRILGTCWNMRFHKVGGYIDGHQHWRRKGVQEYINNRKLEQVGVFPDTNKKGTKHLLHIQAAKAVDTDFQLGRS